MRAVAPWTLGTVEVPLSDVVRLAEDHEACEADVGEAIAVDVAERLDLEEGPVIDVAMTITPMVIGPDQIPRITDPEVARRSPELAVLSALAHGSEPEGESIAMAALAGMPMLDNMREMFYVDLVLHHLGPAARAILEKLMSTTNYQFQSEFAQKYFFEGKEEGELKGEAKMLLRIIDRRGVAISSHDRERVMGCADASQIEMWADRALTATTRDEIFES
jgi:hypothetical protein